MARKDFPDDNHKQLVQKILLQKGLMLEREVQGEFVLPGCLPIAHSPEELLKDTDEVLYLDVGVLSPNFVPTLMQTIHDWINRENPSKKKIRPGAPQVFRNRGEFCIGKSSVSVSFFPVATRKRVLRILVKDDSKDKNLRMLNTVKRILMTKYLGFDTSEVEPFDPASFFGFDQDRCERSFACTPCMNPTCEVTCSLCRLWGLLQERYLSDLDKNLRTVVERVALFPQHTRPAGSFRFQSIKFPGDVDLEEYVVIDARSADEALEELCSEIQQKFSHFTAHSGVFFGGLKAGRAGDSEWLTWSEEDLQKRRVFLKRALREGHHTWTAKVDLFAKVQLFEDPKATPRFFEVTNVLRAGFCEGANPVQPITKEKDFLEGVEMNLQKYSGKEPNVIKYLKRLWERSTFLAQRGFDIPWHLKILEALQPLFAHWSAHMSQAAAHIETLINMTKSDLMQHALMDLPTLSCLARTEFFFGTGLEFFCLVFLVW